MKFVNINEQQPLTQLHPQMQQRVPLEKNGKEPRSLDQSKVSNISVVQKELRPNKVVNKGNSVFSNSHKYSKPSDRDSAKDKGRIIEVSSGPGSA